MNTIVNARLALLISAAAGLASITQFARAELVVNGSFEFANPIGWSQQNGNGFPSYGYANAQAHTGTQSVYFANPFGANDQFYQTLATTAASMYTLSFWVFNPQTGSDHLRLTWEGTQVFDQLPLTIPLNQWTQFSMTLTATQNGSQLRLWGYDIPDRYYVDDVSVTETPAPGAAAIACGAGLLALRRRR